MLNTVYPLRAFRQFVALAIVSQDLESLSTGEGERQAEGTDQNYQKLYDMVVHVAFPLTWFESDFS